jgi:hypothetical protein
MQLVRAVEKASSYSAVLPLLESDLYSAMRS